MITVTNQDAPSVAPPPGAVASSHQPSRMIIPAQAPRHAPAPAPDLWGTPFATALTLARLDYIPLIMHQPADTPNGCTCYNPTPGDYQRLTCSHPGKHPRHKWKDLISHPAALIRERFNRWPEAGVGLKMGPQKLGNLWGLDADPGGLALLAELERRHGPLPKTPTQRTRRNGLHYIRLAPADGPPVKTTVGGDPDGIAPDLDTRGRGGILRFYGWLPDLTPLDVPPAMAPDWLLALVPWDVPRSSAPPPATDYTPASLDPDTAETIIREGLAHDSRHMGGLHVATQCRDEGWSELDTEHVMRDYWRRTASKAHPYDWPDAEHAIRDAFSRAPRAARLKRRAVQVVPVRAPVAIAADVPDLTVEELRALAIEQAEQIAALETERALLAALLAREQHHRQWTNELMSRPNVKDSVLRMLYWIRNPLEQGQHPDIDQPAAPPDTPASVTLCDLARHCDKSPKMIKRHIQTAQVLGWITDTVLKDEEGPHGETLTRIYVTPAAELITSPAALPAAPKVNRGGARHERWCPVCRSPWHKIETVRCLNCGTVYPADADDLDADADTVQDVPEAADPPLAADAARLVQRSRSHLPRWTNRTSAAPPPVQPGLADQRRASAILYADDARAQRVRSASSTLARRAGHTTPAPEPDPAPGISTSAAPTEARYEPTTPAARPLAGGIITTSPAGPPVGHICGGQPFALDAPPVDCPACQFVLEAAPPPALLGLGPPAPDERPDHAPDHATAPPRAGLFD